MSSRTRRVMLWAGLVMVLGLSLALGYLAYCHHRAAYPQDIVGVDRIAKPTGLAPSPDGIEDEAPVEYEYFDKLGVSNWHRVGAQIFYIAKGPIFALIVLGGLLIVRVLWLQPREAKASSSTPIDPLAD